MTNPDIPPGTPVPSAGAMIQKMLEVASANCSPVVWTDKGVYLYGIFYPRRPLLYSDKECPGMRGQKQEGCWRDSSKKSGFEKLTQVDL